MASKPHTQQTDIDTMRDTANPESAQSIDTMPKVIATSEDASQYEISRNIAFKHSHFRDHPFAFLKEIQMMYSGTDWRAFENPVGQPIFYKGFTENMRDNILNNSLVKTQIKQLAKQRINVEDKSMLFPTVASKEKRQREIEASLQEVAATMANGMICKMESKPFIKSAYFLAAQVLSRTYHQGVHVSTEEVVRLTNIANQAAELKQSLVFLPCHRSHIDYVSLQIICYRLGLALPAVVAGDNLNFPVVGAFLQNAGAFYIRRQMGDDVLYGTMVQAYVDTLLRGGFNMECFVEGTRSRTGKLLPPKFGILNFILSSILSGRVKDCFIVPVSTQYDKVIETESYISELLGVPKKKENLYDFLSSSSVLSLKMGRVDVRFHEPWSLRDFITKTLDRRSTSSIPTALQGTIDLTTIQRIKLLRSLGYKVLSDINACSVVMPTSLIGTILLTLRGRGVGKSELIRRIEWLKARIRAKGGKVAHFGTSTEVVVDRGLEVLGDLVGRADGLAEATYYAVDRFQLSFYRNMVIHLFILESIVCAAMYTRVKQGGGPANQQISYDDLFKHVTFLSQVFRGEFIFPTEGITANLQSTIRGLEFDGVIRVERGDKGDEDVKTMMLSDEERERGRENFDFYCFMIWPFIETVWLAGVTIVGLTPYNNDEGWVDTKGALDMAQLLGKTLYHQGDLSYFEAVNAQSLRAAFQRFQEDDILQTRKLTLPKPNSQSTISLPQIRISKEWIPERGQDGQIKPLGKLWEMVEMIAVTRREGKNRRDNATVSTRVLRLTEKLGGDLLKKEGERKEGELLGDLKARL